MTISLHFGALCDLIEEQLITQGYSISKEDSKWFQEIADAIIMLKLHGILPAGAVHIAHQKLMKKICSADSLAEQTP